MRAQCSPHNTDLNAHKPSAGADAGKKRKRKAQQGLNRPIICICNDLYAPALRPLRDVALVVHFRAPSSDRLAARLQQICKHEGIAIDRPVGWGLAHNCELAPWGMLFEAGGMAVDRPVGRGLPHDWALAPWKHFVWARRALPLKARWEGG